MNEPRSSASNVVDFMAKREERAREEAYAALCDGLGARGVMPSPETLRRARALLAEATLSPWEKSHP